jgi:hypothetical protein
MNERIRELATLATTYIEPTATSGEGWIFDKEKFAELIVKETMQVVANQLPSNQYLDVAHAVIEHFGVEEHHAD